MEVLGKAWPAALLVQCFTVQRQEVDQKNKMWTIDLLCINLIFVVTFGDYFDSVTCQALLL